MDYSASLELAAAVKGGAVRRPAQPLDASALDPDSLDDWLERFHWPVGDADFDGFARVVVDRFATAVEAAGPRDAQLLLSDYAFIGFVLQHLHLKAAAAAFGAAAAEAVAGPITKLHLGPDWDEMARAFERAPGFAQLGKLHLRGLAKSWLLNRHLPLIKRLRTLLPGCPTRVLGSFTPLMTEFPPTGAAPARHIYAETALPRRAAPLPVGENLIREAGRLLVEVDRAARARLGTALDVEAALGCWVRRLAALNGLAAGARGAHAAPKRLLLFNSGNVHHRLLAQIWREQGAEIIGFHHGNEMGTQPSLLAGMAEFSLCDTFVAPTAKCAEWLGWVRDSAPALGTVRFVSAETGRYRALRRAMGGPPPKTIKRLMIVAFPLSWIRYPGYAAHYALLQLDVELRLARHLRANGYEVILKVHPEWQTLAERLWQGRVDALPAAPFEQCWREADAFVFPRVSSTAFGYALCTNRPVIVLNPPEQSWNPEAVALLCRRCRFVPSHVDASNRLRFDGDALLAALAEPPGMIDYSFVEAAMYPTPRENAR
jgi:hypothetical protein